MSNSIGCKPPQSEAELDLINVQLPPRWWQLVRPQLRWRGALKWICQRKKTRRPISKSCLAWVTRTCRKPPASPMFSLTSDPHGRVIRQRLLFKVHPGAFAQKKKKKSLYCFFWFFFPFEIWLLKIATQTTWSHFWNKEAVCWWTQCVCVRCVRIKTAQKKNGRKTTNTLFHTHESYQPLFSFSLCFFFFFVHRWSVTCRCWMI